MADFGMNLRKARKEKKLTQRQLADLIGAKHNSVSNWETGINKPDPDTISLICGVLHISPNDLMGSEAVPLPHPDALPVSRRSVPLLGSIACGEPIFADEDYSVSVALGHDVDCDFALRCKGDSMIGARIYDGDIVFIKKQDFVDDWHDCRRPDRRRRNAQARLQVKRRPHRAARGQRALSADLRRRAG